jgi:chromate reductase, NAD(P)H dehydrogenase (quinone)
MTDPDGPILLVSGSTRAGSTNTALVRTARQLAPFDRRGVLYEGLAGLPHFNPDHDTDTALPKPVAELRTAIGSAAAVLICTPEYAGALPGSFKNLLDWTVGGGEIYGKPVAWVNVSAAPTGAIDAHESLAKVLERVGADVIRDACQHIPVTRTMVGSDGLVHDQATRQRLRAVLDILTSQKRR